MDLVHWVCELRRAACLEALLQHFPSTADAMDRKKRTPLHIACEHGDIDCVRILLKYGADTESKDRSAETPLHKAARQGSTEVVALLCESQTSSMNRRNKRQQTPLLAAAEMGHLSVVKMLLKHGASLVGRYVFPTAHCCTISSADSLTTGVLLGSILNRTVDGLDVCAFVARSGDVKLLQFIIGLASV